MATEIAAIERLKVIVSTFCRLKQRILFILASNEVMNKILDEFEFSPDQTIDNRVCEKFQLTYNGTMVSQFF